MPLNKLENFIKNAEGRILYVNPNDLDSTDGIENQGNSLTKPFKTIQRALIESARFSYLRGGDNDLVEKTTILVFPGEHLIDNRPGFAIRDNGGGNALAVAPGGSTSNAQETLTLTLNSNFDLTQEDNILYKYNSVHGGIIIPRGTSIVGLDLRKTKVRPKYVPNPTDDNVPDSAIFRITGACYFWQFTFFDGDESGLVYTDNKDFSSNNKSKPTFSHHKLTCFEYADGVNKVENYPLTDLDMYYAKLSNAFNRSSGREIDQKFPAVEDGFSKQRPEWEIVGAFASDPVNISTLISGDGATPGNIVTVSTQTDHGLNAGTPIKIRGVSEADFNISTKVVQVINDSTFTYALPSVRANLPAGPAAGLQVGNATVTIETDTVSGASPYIFNTSLRSVYGMNGMHADGSKADGFRSMVVAQFTAVSLQKDDRAFTKYISADRKYDQDKPTLARGEELSQKANSENAEKIYHLDSDAVYREGWQSKHIKMSNDAVIQIVSVFAIGFHKHFECLTGGDASITNSNSNFGQFSLASDGFKKDAFGKDDKGYITSIIPPRTIENLESEVEWVQINVAKTKAIGVNDRIYLLGYDSLDVPPPIISQGYRIGAKVDEVLSLDGHGAKILMPNGPFDSTTGQKGYINPTTKTSAKVYNNVYITTANPQNGKQTVFNFTSGHELANGESVRIFSEVGDLPDGLERGKVYYAVTSDKNSSRSDGITLLAGQIQLASSKTNADAQNPIYITAYPNTQEASEKLQLRIESRVSDKKAGDLGHPIQFDSKNQGTYTFGGNSVNLNVGGWFILTESNSALYAHVSNLPVDESEITVVKRRADDRSLDEKLYRMRYVIPKEFDNTRDPVNGFVIQDSSSVNVRETDDHTKTDITRADYDFDRNTRFISTCTYSAGVISSINSPGFNFRSDKPHNLEVGDIIVVSNVTDESNPTGIEGEGYNGEFIVGNIENDKEFQVSSTDVFGVTHAPAAVHSNAVNTRNTVLPRFTRNNNQRNFYIYRVETISNYIKDVQDGVFYLYVLNASNSIESEFTVDKFSQNVTDLYPQLDRDNDLENPPAANSYARRSPIGEVNTDDLKRSITRETIDKYNDSFGIGQKIINVVDGSNTTTITFDGPHQLGAIRTVTNLDGGSGHTEGTYYNVKLLNNGTTVWDGATAKVVVNSSGVVTDVEIIEGGSGYTAGEELDIDWRTSEGGIGGSSNAHVDTHSVGISLATNDYVQITGISTATDSYRKITTCNVPNQIVVSKSSTDPEIYPGQYSYVVGRVATKSSTSISHTQISTTVHHYSVTTTEAHGLVKGNKIRLTDSSNESLGDFNVIDVDSATSFKFLYEGTGTASTFNTLTHIMKHGMSANSGSADNLNENIGGRSLPNYDNEILLLTSDVTTTEDLPVQLPSGASDIISRFPLGSYIQIGDEIMRVASTTLKNPSPQAAPTSGELKVIRGSMGTIISAHATETQIKKIKLQPVELRRPSILRASGHTFEYLGYGPGNYSTGLPQVQVKTLSENEEFLSQSQETSCGTVLYTGMDSDGDFYIGNTKYSAQSGEQTTFDVPTPTITGQDPNRLSVVFDEVIVKERILVEGGKSKQILSQFDGPVTFNGPVRMNNKLFLNDDIRLKGKFKILDDTDATIDCSTGVSSGALTIAGGIAIGKSLHVCEVGSFNSTNNLTTLSARLASNPNGVGTPSGLFKGGVYIDKDLHVDEDMWVQDELTANDRLHVTNCIRIGGPPTTSPALTSLLGNSTEPDAGLVPSVDAAANNGYGVAIGSKNHAFAEAHIGRIQIGHYDGTPNNGNQHITTRSGELKLDSASGRVEILKQASDELIVTGTTNLNGNTSITGTLNVSSDTTFSGNATISGDVTINDDLFVNDNANFASNSVQIRNSRVIAGTFEGRADEAKVVEIGKVVDGSNSTGIDDFQLIMAPVGQSVGYKKIYRDNNLRFNEPNHTLTVSSGNNYISLNGSTGEIRASGDIYAFLSSDERLKDNISKIEDPLAKVVSLGGYTFDWNEKTHKDGTETGVIAQEVESLGLPGIVTTRDDGYKAVHYEKLVPLLIEAIKELNDKVSSLEDKLNN